MNLTNHKSTLQARGNKNKITIDMDILSTGEKQKAKCGGRRKFLSGGTALGLQLGAAGVSSLIDGIAGTINENRLIKMYNNMTRKSTYVPVAREHIDTRVNVEPQLDAIRNAEYRQNRAIDVNTNSSKNALNRKRDLMLAGLEKRQEVNAYKNNTEAQLRNAEAKLQTKYNVLDVQNKIADITAQNEFDAQKLIGKTNAKNIITQSWGDAAANFLQNSGISIGDYMLMNYDLLSTNNKENKEFADYNLSDKRFIGKSDGTLQKAYARTRARKEGKDLTKGNYKWDSKKGDFVWVTF